MIWKALPGYEGFYDVSDTGLIRCWSTWHISTQRKRKNGTMLVSVRSMTKKWSNSLMVHRAVADAFIPNPNGHKYVGHIDGNKSNNVVSNLFWTKYQRGKNYEAEREALMEVRKDETCVC